MAEYLIQEETLIATADKIREKLGILSLYGFDSKYIDGNGNLTQEITVYYTKYIDSPEGYDDQVGSSDFNFVRYAYFINNEGKTVPVLLDDYDIERADPHYYEGTETINGVVYDKWRKLSTDKYAWDNDAKCYKYTNIIVNINKYSPADFPSKIDEVYDDGYNDGRGGATSIISNGTMINIELAPVTQDGENIIIGG